MIALRPQQQTALALLGYKLWLPRAELAALRATPPAPSAEREKTAPRRRRKPHRDNSARDE